MSKMKFGYMLDFRNPETSHMDFGTFYSAMFRQISFSKKPASIHCGSPSITSSMTATCPR